MLCIGTGLLHCIDYVTVVLHLTVIIVLHWNLTIEM